MLQKRAIKLQRESSKQFHSAFGRAQEAVIRGQAELAVEWCLFAASIAWRVNPGFFYCGEMEQLLGEIGRGSMGPAPAPVSATAIPRRFLHVLTTAYERGGHTRAVYRWIEICAQHSPGETHSILISNQGEEPVPPPLACSARKTGGELIECPQETGWLQKAAYLRTMSMKFDAIVLHVHPNDPLPNLAFFDHPRPVLFFNHADHVFSLGTDVATAIADIRLAGQDISTRFRSRRPHKCLLPIPLIDDKPFPSDKAGARRKLGLPLDAPIALTIGEWYKYQPTLGYNFAETLDSICAADAHVVVVAIGSSELKGFHALDHLNGTRFRPVGFVHDPEILDLYYMAADVYLDSIPCGSLTCLLDAARQALPVQRLNNPYLPVLWSDDPALDSVLMGVNEQDQYVAGALECLQWSEPKRMALGERFRNAVLQEHCGEAWKNKWLEPALKVLMLSEPAIADPATEATADHADDISALATLPRDESPASMILGATLMEIPDLDKRIRWYAIWRSIKPWLFDTEQDGNWLGRFLVFRRLVKTVLPRPVIIATASLLRPFLSKL